METDVCCDPRVKSYERKTRRRADPGTRIYRERSPQVYLHAWLEELQAMFAGELVPFEWVADYVEVSRAAVHKRVKAGGLTLFVFEMEETVRGVLGGLRERMRGEYRYVPKSECDHWRSILLDRDLAERAAEASRNRKK